MESVDIFHVGKSTYLYCGEKEPLIDICNELNIPLTNIEYTEKKRKYKIESESIVLAQKTKEIMKRTIKHKRY